MRLIGYFIIIAAFFAVFISGVRVGAGANAPIVLGEVVCVIVLAMINVERIRRPNEIHHPPHQVPRLPLAHHFGDPLPPVRRTRQGLRRADRRARAVGGREMSGA